MTGPRLESVHLSAGLTDPPSKSVHLILELWGNRFALGPHARRTAFSYYRGQKDGVVSRDSGYLENRVLRPFTAGSGPAAQPWDAPHSRAERAISSDETLNTFCGTFG